MIAGRPLLGKCVAVLLLSGMLACLVGLAMAGFLGAQAVGEQIDAKQAELRSLRQRASLLINESSGDDGARRAEAVLTLLLPASFSGSAGARLQHGIIKTIERANGRAGIVRVLPSVSEHALTRVTVNVAFRADMVGLRKILHEIETTTPLMFVDQLDISVTQPRERAERSELTIELQVSSYMPQESGS